MTTPIQFPVSNPSIAPLTGQSAQTPALKGNKDFKSILLDSLEQVNQLQNEADVGIQKLMTGEDVNVAEVFATANKAGIAFDLLMEVRNKLTEAYREINQMQV